MRLSRILLKLGLLGLAWLAGCGRWGDGSGGQVMYGPVNLNLPHDPTVVLQDFSYTPASPIHVGDLLTLQAVLSQTTMAGNVRAVVNETAQAVCDLHDDGIAPDATARDGIFSGEFYWAAWQRSGTALPVWVELIWQDGADGQTLSGPPLTVLPPEEGGQ